MFCVRISTLWMALALFVVPVISQEYDETLSKYGLSENFLKEDCKNTSAIDFGKQEFFYQEFVKCVQNTVDLKMMNQDFRLLLRTIILAHKFNSTLSDMYKSSLQLFSKNYCPKFTTLMNCAESYSSIYVDCLTTAEVMMKKIKRDTIRNIIEFFCKNDAEQIINLSNGKLFECAMTKPFELKGCLKMFFITKQVIGENRDNEALMTSTYCKSIDDFFNCTTSIFSQCTLAETTGTLMESLKTYIQEKGICSTTGDATKMKMSLL
ncbi:hypothetical protein Bhyg_17258 [Pseudolycoriella hygida]|uniref:Uncharacterized protein n=1 Tax=Pseudolycoriella hygida TaxID=35572 RepID=A0A9Q0MJX7_9DIPT|nr:hypothetical protein Bhyg_17258 [Pseudolycoriella hygida]